MHIAEPKDKYRADALRMAQIIRAHRKRLGLDQSEAAQLFGIQQPYLSKIERGNRPIQLDLWMAVCDLWKLDYDCFQLGYVDIRQPIAVLDTSQVGKYRIPGRYARNQGSTMRAFRLFRNYGVARLGQEAVDWFFLERDMDPDYCVHADHQINYRFTLDFLSYLAKKTPLLLDIPNIVAPLNGREPHGILTKVYDRKIGDSLSAVLALAEQAKSYELNFEYQVENLSANSLVVSAKPGPYMNKFKQHCEDAGLSRFICAYKSEFIARFSTYGQNGVTPVTVTHSMRDCVLAGADRCMFSIKLTA